MGLACWKPRALACACSARLSHCLKIGGFRPGNSLETQASGTNLRYGLYLDYSWLVASASSCVNNARCWGQRRSSQMMAVYPPSFCSLFPFRSFRSLLRMQYEDGNLFSALTKDAKAESRCVGDNIAHVAVFQPRCKKHNHRDPRHSRDDQCAL